MRGSILGVSGGRGVLSDENGRRLEFAASEWKSPGAPRAGQAVDFVELNGEASAVFLAPNPVVANDQSPAFWLGLSSMGCLVLSFVFPLFPTIAALVLGILGAQKSKVENNGGALVMSRIGWIGAIVMLALYVLFVLAMLAFFGTMIGTWVTQMETHSF